LNTVVKNFIHIENQIKSKAKDFKINDLPKIIAVSKTFKIDHILPLVEYGHLDYGENKVQEALDKWHFIKEKYKNIKLHLIGKLQTNKVKKAVKIFDFIHSVDNERLAKKILDEQNNQGKKTKIFLQVNVGNELQKSGVSIHQLKNLYNYCKELDLDVVGLMCIPPISEDNNRYFKEMSNLRKSLNLKELSMGMSSDFLQAMQNQSTYLRIGTSIFGKRFYKI